MLVRTTRRHELWDKYAKDDMMTAGDRYGMSDYATLEQE
jgi:hypothetical protein